MTLQLALLPFHGVDERTLAWLAARLGEKGFACTMLEAAAIPPQAYHPQRAQYRVKSLLETARQATPGRVLGVADLDLYANGYNYVFGMAEKQGRAAVISVARLHTPDKARFRARLLKEAVHELGHTLGLAHCRQPDCVMHFSNTLADTDRKGADFCAGCEARLAALRL